MKVLETNKLVLKWLALYTIEESATKWKKRIYFVFSLLFFIGVASMVLSSFLFFLKYVSTNLEEALYGYGQVNASMGPFYMLIVAFAMRKKFIAMIDGLSEIYKQNENADSFHYLTEANDKSEWIWAIYFKYIMKAFLIMVPLSTIISIIFCMTKYGTLDVKYLYHPYRLMLPWNDQTFFGYLGEILFSLMGNQTYCFGNGAFMLLLVSMSLHHKAFYNIFQHSLHKLGCYGGNQNDKKILCDLVRFHVSVKGWFFESVDVYSFLVLIVLFGNMLYMAGAIFLLDLYSKHMNFNFIFILMVTFVSCANLFVYCLYGKMATECFENMSYCLYESNWQKLPIKLQEHIVLMIANSQRSIFYHGFGIAVLNLETFTSMVRIASTYYMAFKTLTSD